MSEWKVKFQGAEFSLKIDIEPGEDSAMREAWAKDCAESFTIAMADQLGLEDGRVVPVTVISSNMQEYCMHVRATRVWNAEVVS